MDSVNHEDVYKKSWDRKGEESIEMDWTRGENGLAPYGKKTVDDVSKYGVDRG